MIRRVPGIVVLALVTACADRECPDALPSPKCDACSGSEVVEDASEARVFAEHSGVIVDAGVAVDGGAVYEKKFATVDAFVTWLNENGHKAAKGGKLSQITMLGAIEEQPIILDGKRSPGCMVFENEIQWAYVERYVEAVAKNGLKLGPTATYFNVKCFPFR